MVGAFVRVAAGHYTNRRGDTLGASPETRERETGKKNFEMNQHDVSQQCTKPSQCMMDDFLCIMLCLIKRKYKVVQLNVLSPLVLILYGPYQ